MSRSSLKGGQIRSAVILYNLRKPSAQKEVSAVRSLLRSRSVGVRVAHGDRLDESMLRCDAAVAIGGDGSMLHAARLLAGTKMPILGVNTGGLGFLSAVDMSGFRRNIGRILSGGFHVYSRSMLSVEVRRGGRRVFGPHAVLNDCVLRASDQARAVTLKAFESGHFIATYFGDGLIVSTPTGSTAYALAVGGPVVHPGIAAVLLAPICPHTLTQRPLLLPADSPVCVELARRNPQEDPQALVSVDGQVEHAIEAGDEVHVAPFAEPVRLLFDPEKSYFEVLRAKLKWGER